MRSLHTAMSPDSSKPATQAPKLDETIIAALDHYFVLLGDQKPHALHDMVMAAVEKPLLKYVMQRYQGNVSHASLALGMTRTTLRTKLKQHGMSAESFL
jgi:Fis family transcriptional regulator, factor for inversion stimulation protein